MHQVDNLIYLRSHEHLRPISQTMKKLPDLRVVFCESFQIRIVKDYGKYFDIVPHEYIKLTLLE